MNALSNNVESVTNLVKAQSEIIENLSTQVSSVVKGTSNEKEFKRVFDKIANQSKLIYNVTKKLNKTINHVNELAAVWSQTSIRFENEMKNLEEDADENEEKIENVEKKIMDKIEKLQEQMKLLHASVNYVSEAAESSKEGKAITLLWLCCGDVKVVNACVSLGIWRVLQGLYVTWCPTRR